MPQIYQLKIVVAITPIWHPLYTATELERQYRFRVEHLWEEYSKSFTEQLASEINKWLHAEEPDS
jgi:hypothetical protein